MSLLINNIKYVIQGSNEDNGDITNHYYIEYTIDKTYNIKYDGDNGTITTSQKCYIDTQTKQIIKKDSLYWKMECDGAYSANVCDTITKLESLYKLINDTNTDGIKLSIDDIINNTDNDLSQSDIDKIINNGNINGIDRDNNSSNSNNTSENNNNNKIPNIIDNTLGSSTYGKDRAQLPKGADPNNDTVTAGISDVKESVNIAVGNNLMNKGTVYPIIRIRDHYFSDDEIQYFSMETGFRKSYYDYAIYKNPITGFLPTMTLIITTTSKSLLKKEIVTNGDRCSVFFTSGNQMIKSMRCDFRITNVTTNEMNQNMIDPQITQTIYGELYVPNLRNEKVRYNFNGTTRDGMMDAAKRLKLSFFFCDPEDTDDVMVWCCCKTPMDFIVDMTTHAWKNEQSFFESWIDPRYGLSFQNINRLLGEDGLDEDIDFTIFQKAFVNHRGIDGTNAEYTEEQTKTTNTPQAKIFSNIADERDTLSPYHINKWRMYNNAQAIQDFIGLNCTIQMDSNNPGMDGNSQYSVETSLCINRTKCPDDGTGAFYVLVGPGRNDTFENADDYMGVSETENSNSIAPVVISQPMSDGDSANILSTGGNMLSSGNTHKFYEVAYQHNMRNLLQLQKQYIVIELNGANLSIVRGEKMPVVLVDHDKTNSYMRSGKAINISDVLYETESGWYIIDGIEWVFDPGNSTTIGTGWSTKVRLTKREWPIPGKNDTKDGNNTETIVTETSNERSVKKAEQDKDQLDDDKIYDGGVLPEFTVTATRTTNTSEDNDLDEDYSIIKDEDKVQGTEIPLTGLKPYMKQLYKDIETESNNRVKLVAAKRWAVDADGNKVEGNAFLENHGYYKCVNAIGDTMYFKQNNSKHLYGEAIDIINTNGIGFNELMTDIIMKSPTILTTMYNNGISAYIEQAQDDNGVVTKHYHFGTDTIKQKAFWNSVKAVNNKSTIIPGTYIDFSSYQSKNKTINEINNNIVKEIIDTK